MARSSSDDALRLDQQLCFALYRASRAVIREYTPLLEPLGLTYLQYLVMLVLWERDGLAVREIGDRLALDSGTLTPLLKKMEQQGLVERRRDESDERVVRIALTARGRGMRAKAREVPMQIACRAGLDPSDPHARARLVKLRDELDALVKGIPQPADAISRR